MALREYLQMKFYNLERRYGSDFGTFTSPEGIPYEMRALAPGTDMKPYSVFEVVEPINVKAGEIAPWFD